MKRIVIGDNGCNIRLRGEAGKAVVVVRKTAPANVGETVRVAWKDEANVVDGGEYVVSFVDPVPHGTRETWRRVELVKRPKEAAMLKLKRSDCAVLPLVLKRKWYDMIASGEKREEYRESKPYWDKRICGWLASEGFSVVAFSKGYVKPDLFFRCDYAFCRDAGEANQDWGEPNTAHWVIGIGERVELED